MTRHFLFIIILVLAKTFAEDSFDCTGYEDDSYHPIYDADDCRHYWHCIYVNTVYMHAVKRVCPAGTEFDIRLRQCETASEVNCRPVQSPHGPRTTSTTRAWKLKYSRLFSRIFRTSTISSSLIRSTKKHSIFDFDEPVELELTTTMINSDIQVLPVTQSTFSIEQLSKSLRALIANRKMHKQRLSAARFFQPGEPENEAEIYTSMPTTTTTTTTTTSTKRRTRRTRTTTQLTTELPLTTETITTMLITTTAIDTTIMTISTPITELNTILPRIIWNKDNHRRRKNMTLYILTSDDHKIRQFPVNHTRGILINCNQLRRRLLGRRRHIRDTSLLTPITSFQSLINVNQSTKLRSQSNLFVFISFSCMLFRKRFLFT